MPTESEKQSTEKPRARRRRRVRRSVARLEALEKAEKAAEEDFSANDAGSDTLPCGLKKLSWIEVVVCDTEGNPVPGARYHVTGKGVDVEGTVDDAGKAIVNDLPIGEYRVVFPTDDEDPSESGEH